MGVQAENLLSKHNPTMDHCECHPRSPLCPPIRGLYLLCPRGCLAYIPSVTSWAARQSWSGSITITQQLCVFVEDYIFKRTLRGGVSKVVWQTMKVLTQGCRKQRPSPPVTLLCGKINPHNTEQTWLTVLLSSPQYSLSLSLSPLSAWPFSFPSCQGAGREVFCQVEIIHQKAKYWHRMICLVTAAG